MEHDLLKILWQGISISRLLSGVSLPPAIELVDFLIVPLSSTYLAVPVHWWPTCHSTRHAYYACMHLLRACMRAYYASIHILWKIWLFDALHARTSMHGDSISGASSFKWCRISGNLVGSYPRISGRDPHDFTWILFLFCVFPRAFMNMHACIIRMHNTHACMHYLYAWDACTICMRSMHACTQKNMNE